jgi:hypothetical protein
VVPLAPKSNWDEVKDWASAFVHTMVADAFFQAGVRP